MRYLAMSMSTLGALALVAGRAPAVPIADAASAMFTGAPGDRAGAAVVQLGDVNGDGFPDVAVGAETQARDYLPGKTYIVYGPFPASTDLGALGSRGIVIDGPHTVDRAGDFNGDGYDDVFLSYPDASVNADRTWILFGGPSLPSSLGVTTLDTYGMRISKGSGSVRAPHVGIGDLNGDGLADVIVSVAPPSQGRAGAGDAYVIYGRQAPPASLDLTQFSATDGFVMSVPTSRVNIQSVAAVGDVNGDGRDDVAIGVRNGGPFPPVNVRPPGAVFVLFGRPPSAPFANFKLSAIRKQGGFKIVERSDLGGAVAGVGDFDGDGLDDVLVGTPAVLPLNLNGRPVGAAYVVRGKADGKTVNLRGRSFIKDHTAYEIRRQVDYLQYFGLVVAGVGRFNGDTFADVAVMDDDGRIAVVFGGSSLPPSIDVDAVPGSADFFECASCRALGGGNGSLLAGTVSLDSTESGASYLVTRP